MDTDTADTTTSTAAATTATAATAPIAEKLRTLLGQMQKRNPAFSLRGLARKLDMSSAALSEIMRERRAVSLRTARRIVERLGLAPLEADELMRLAAERAGASSRQDEGLVGHVPLADRLFAAVSATHHFAILSLSETADFRLDARWIGQRLGLPSAAVDAALARMQQIGLIAIENGRLRKPTSCATSDGNDQESIRRSHAESLGEALRSLREDPTERRDFTSMTMAIDPARMPEAKRRIRACLEDLCTVLEVEPKTEVYKVCVQLFPLSHRD